MATAPLYIYGDTCTAVLNLARARVDDLLQQSPEYPTGSGPDVLQEEQVGGSTLLKQRDDDDNVFLPTQVTFNTAWRKSQLYMTQNGWRGLIDTFILASIPAVDSNDIAEQCYLTWNGFWDGTAFTSSPALPETFVAPLKLRERVHESDPDNMTGFTDMITGLYGLRNVQTRSELNRQWEWRNNALYFIGATEVTDLQIRCISLYGDFVEFGMTPSPWYEAQIPIPRFASALAWFVAYEVCIARLGEAGAAGVLKNAQDEAMAILSNQRRGDGIEPLAANLTNAAPVEAE